MHGDIWPKINSQIEKMGNQMKEYDDDLAKLWAFGGTIQCKQLLTFNVTIRKRKQISVVNYKCFLFGYISQDD